MPRSRRLVVVSNRGPYRVAESGGKRRRVRAMGGLVSALDPVLAKRGGVWVSADDDSVQELPDASGEPMRYDLASVKLSRSDREGFYLGVSNSMLWPILHSMPPTVRMRRPAWKHYESANRAFSETIAGVTKPRDLLWIHDFHLMLVPQMLRELGVRARIGWFCHIPWPGFDLFEILPWREQVLEGLLGADVIGFHTDAYAQNFLACAARHLGRGRVDPRGRRIRVGDRTIDVIIAPVGIPVPEIEALAADPKVSAGVERIRRWVGERRIILGVDRLDYTKGIPQRLLAFEQVLRADRDARNQFLLVQVMVPSRTDVRAYADLKIEIDRLVGDINGRFSVAGRVPIHYFYREMNQTELFAHYRAADVALLTPLRDGMNLVALEYAACRSDGGGVLVLSEFAGAAQYLREAVIVNPYDGQGVAAALRKALSMPADEARTRMQALRKQVKRMDVHRWADQFLGCLESS
jgi:trehalose 6-phosphate synthase